MKLLVTFVFNNKVIKAFTYIFVGPSFFGIEYNLNKKNVYDKDFNYFT